MKRILIRLHNKILGEAVKAVLKKCDREDNSLVNLALEFYSDKNPCIQVGGHGGIGTYGPRVSYDDVGGHFDIEIDAATEMGKLIGLLKREVRILKVTPDHDGILADDKQTIKIGCTTVSREKVK